MQTQAMTNKIYTADRDFHFRVKDPGSAATHFIGFVAAVLMTPVLLVHAAGNGADFMTMIGMSVFMISMILLYGASTSYHSFDISEKANLRLKRLDHIMIFVLIAGSYTPVCLTVLRHGVGMRLLAIVWGYLFRHGLGLYSGYAAASCGIIIWRVHVASGRRIVLYSGRRDLCDEVSCIP